MGLDLLRDKSSHRVAEDRVPGRDSVWAQPQVLHARHRMSRPLFKQALALRSTDRSRGRCMPVFQSSLDPGSAASAGNRAHMLALIARHDELRERTAAASGRAGPRFARRGQLLPRERLALLLDAGAPLLELAACAGYLMDVADPDKSIAGRRPRGRHRRDRRHALRRGGRRFRHRGRRAAAHGTGEVPARAAARAGEPAAVRAPGRVRRRQPAALPGRGLHLRRLALRAPRAAVGGGHPGADDRARQRDRRRRLHARDVRLRGDGARPRARVPGGAAAAQGRHRRDRHRRGTGRRADACGRVGPGGIPGRRRRRRHPGAARARRPPRLAPARVARCRAPRNRCCRPTSCST